MPIYEFYCDRCHAVYQFLSRRIDTRKRPDCPECGRPKLARQASAFAAHTGGKKDEGDAAGEGLGDLPVDESRMEAALESMASEADHLDENDPRQAAGLMRKFSDLTGLEMKGPMKEAMDRLAAGEDPESVEQSLGGALDAEDPFAPAEKTGAKAKARGKPPSRPGKIYPM